MPWQEVAAMYATAQRPNGSLLYREFAALVARQQGKTTLAKPLVVGRLKRGRHVMHIAQLRELPRIMFEQIADSIEATDPSLFPRRRGKIIWPRRGAGSESIVLTNGGTYRIAAAITGAARGHSIDDLLIDELREMESFAVINSAKPAQRFSQDPQTIYLSNAGTENSSVLNSLRQRADADPSLAYLEWSADPRYEADDIRGWVQANPAIGHYPQVLRDLELDYLSAKLGGNMAGFETESLCRWVDTLQPTYVSPDAWQRLHGQLEEPHRPYMAVSMAPSGDRATAVLAWRMTTGRVGVRIAVNAFGSPIDVDFLGADLKKLAASRGVVLVGFDPWTDADIARRLPKTKALAGRDFAAASENFARRVSDGSITWDEADQVGIDLGWTTRKQHESGAYHAVRSSDEHSIPAALAAIRAVWLATNEKPPSPKVL